MVSITQVHTILQKVPRWESLYAFLSNMKIESARNTMELAVGKKKGDVLRDLLGCPRKKNIIGLVTLHFTYFRF